MTLSMQSDVSKIVEEFQVLKPTTVQGVSKKVANINL